MLPPGTAVIIGTITALLLTLAVFSRLLGDNGLYRFIQCVFIGLTSGYILALVLRTVIGPRIVLLIQQPQQYWYYSLFFILGLLLLTRGLRKSGNWASLPLGMLFGIGAALTLGGALAGTLIPQTRSLVSAVVPNPTTTSGATWLLLLDGVLVVVGTLAVLGSFQVTLANHGIARAAAGAWHFMGRTLGRGLIMVTFGALYAGALVSFYTLLVGRFLFIQQAITDILRFFGTG